MARVVVDVMLKPEILDPQGQAVQRALDRLGFDRVTAVRQGKRFEIEIADSEPGTGAGTAAAAGTAAELAREMAAKLLANTVIEDFTVRVEGSPAGRP
ncbi:MAG: phosphoribosylformylglycinamidine synthase subunit PurS [Sporichthyaceae bacterium]|nr:phosphoribosylformylglycinamidine synthase subunit PurS [Sporichthyaceae bacterium]